MAARREFEDIGLVLRTAPFAEADVICHMLLDEAGKRGLFARAAKRSKRRFRGGLTTFARLHVVYTAGKPGALSTLRESEVTEVWHNIAQDLDRMAIGFHVIDILQATLEDGQGGGALFKRLTRFMRWLDGEERGAAHLGTGHLRIQLLLLHEAGLLFDLQRSTRSAVSLEQLTRIVFAPDEGFFGVEERQPGERTVTVLPATLLALKTVAEGSFCLDEPAVADAQVLINHVWTHMIGRELKSWRFLADTLRLG